MRALLTGLAALGLNLAFVGLLSAQQAGAPTGQMKVDTQLVELANCALMMNLKVGCGTTPLKKQLPPHQILLLGETGEVDSDGDGTADQVLSRQVSIQRVTSASATEEEGIAVHEVTEYKSGGSLAGKVATVVTLYNHKVVIDRREDRNGDGQDDFRETRVQYR